MSSGEPGGTWAATSAMWTQTRQPLPSRWAEIASSKSRAVAGSTVKVASSVRSRRGTSRASASSAAVGAFSSTRPLKPRKPSRSASRSATASRALAGRSRRERVPPRAPEPRFPSRHPARRPPPAGSPGDLRGDRFERFLPRLVDGRARFVDDFHFRVDAAGARQVFPVRGEEFADRQLQCAAVLEVVLFLEDALAVGPGADDGRAAVLVQCRGKDLGGARRVAVDQDVEGHVYDLAGARLLCRGA